MIKQGANYGGRQSDYLKRARAMIARTEKAIHDAVENKQDLKDLFFTTLNGMGKERRKIARDHQTKTASEFGYRRDCDQYAHTAFTNFSNEYSKYGRKILAQLQGILSQMDCDEWFELKKFVIKDSTFGRASSIKIEISEAEDLRKRGWFTKSLDNQVPKWFPVELCRKDKHTSEEFARLFAGCKRFWIEDPKGYQWLKKGYDFQRLWSHFPFSVKSGAIKGPVEWVEKLISQRSVLVEATVFFEINGKMLPLYGYITCLHRSLKQTNEDLLEKITRDCVAVVEHQSQFLIEETLKDLAHLFEQIICWDRSDLTELKRLMAFFRYEMACMPFHRGTAAITEWLEGALYGYHRIDYQYKGDCLADLEVYCNPLFSDFFKAYDSMCTLKKL
jgi:hypothetical protein